MEDADRDEGRLARTDDRDVRVSVARRPDPHLEPARQDREVVELPLMLMLGTEAAGPDLKQMQAEVRALEQARCLPPRLALSFHLSAPHRRS